MASDSRSLFLPVEVCEFILRDLSLRDRLAFSSISPQYRKTLAPIVFHKLRTSELPHLADSALLAAQKYGSFVKVLEFRAQTFELKPGDVFTPQPSSDPSLPASSDDESDVKELLPRSAQLLLAGEHIAPTLQMLQIHFPVRLNQDRLSHYTLLGVADRLQYPVTLEQKRWKSLLAAVWRQLSAQPLTIRKLVLKDVLPVWLPEMESVGVMRMLNGTIEELVLELFAEENSVKYDLGRATQARCSLLFSTLLQPNTRSLTVHANGRSLAWEFPYAAPRKIGRDRGLPCMMTSINISQVYVCEAFFRFLEHMPQLRRLVMRDCWASAYGYMNTWGLLFCSLAENDPPLDSFEYVNTMPVRIDIGGMLVMPEIDDVQRARAVENIQKWLAEDGSNIIFPYRHQVEGNPIEQYGRANLHMLNKNVDLPSYHRLMTAVYGEKYKKAKEERRAFWGRQVKVEAWRDNPRASYISLANLGIRSRNAGNQTAQSPNS